MSFPRLPFILGSPLAKIVPPFAPFVLCHNGLTGFYRGLVLLRMLLAWNGLLASMKSFLEDPLPNSNQKGYSKDTPIGIGGERMPAKLVCFTYSDA